MSRKENINQFAWNSLDIFSRLGINFFVYFFFLNLLGADKYATFVFITLFCGVAQSLSKLGQNDYLIIKKDINNETLSSILFLNFLIGFASVIFLLIIFASISFFAERESSFLISASLMSISVLITICSNSFLYILQRDQQFKTLFFLNFTSSAFGLLLTYVISGNLEDFIYPVLVVLFTQTFLFVTLIIIKPFKFSISQESLKNLYNESKLFIIPLMKTRPMMVVTKNIDSFSALILGGEILLLAYNTIKKIFIYPLSILYAVLDRWLYPYLAKLANTSEVMNSYSKLTKNIFLTSLITAIFIFLMIQFVDDLIINYARQIGITNVNLILMIYGFLFSWPICVLPTLIYTYAKVVRKTDLLPRFAIVQAISIALCMLATGFIIGGDWITVGYSIAYIIMNIYILKIFKLVIFSRI